jgi:hypothetical protein
MSARSTITISASLPKPVVALLSTAIALQLIAGVVAAAPRAATATSSAEPPVLPASSPTPSGSPAPRPPADRAPAAVPVRIDIPRLGVAAPIDPMALDEEGAITVPPQLDRAGWYSGLEAPGEPGTAVIVGHLDSRSGPAVFARVPELDAGDEIFVELADHSTVRFVVERAEQYDKQRFPTIAVYAPADRPTLRLITCGGRFDEKHRHYDDNVVVYASAQEAT